MVMVLHTVAIVALEEVPTGIKKVNPVTFYYKS